MTQRHNASWIVFPVFFLCFLSPCEAQSVDSKRTAGPVQPAAPSISLSAPRVDFGQLAAGQIAETTLMIRNDGAADLTIDSISGTDTQFRARARGGLSILPGGELPVTLSFSPADYGLQEARLLIHSNAPNNESLEVKLEGAGPDQSSGTPIINSGGVVDGASFQALLAPGEIASLFGTSLTSILAAAAGTPLPIELAGTRVEANGIACPLFFISPEQINFQLPFEVSPGAEAQIVVVRDGVASEPEPVAVAEFAPAIFLNPETSEPIVQRHSDGSLVTGDNPARPGDTLVIFMTGIGGLDNPPPTGSPASSSPLANSLVTPTISLGAAELTVLFAGLAPGFVGLGQINVVLPATLSLEETMSSANLTAVAQQTSTLPLVIRFGENASKPVDLAVTDPGPPPGVIEVTPGSLDFGSVELGASKDLTLNIRNAGEGLLTVNGLTSNAPQFSQVSGQPPVSVEPGQVLPVTVRFQPSAAGTQSAILTVSSDDPDNSAVNVEMSGNGVEPAPLTPKISLSPTSLNFGGVVLGEIGTQQFGVSNDGEGQLIVLSITSSDPSYGVVSPALPFTVPPGAKQDVEVRYLPTDTNLVSMAALSISSNDPNQQLASVSVEGFGRLTLADFNFGSVAIGTERTLTKVLANRTGNDLEIMSITSSGNIQFSIIFATGIFVPGTPRPPFLLRAGQTVSLRARFLPVNGSVSRGQIRARSRGNGPVFVFTMEGQGVF